MNNPTQTISVLIAQAVNLRIWRHRSYNTKLKHAPVKQTSMRIQTDGKYAVVTSDGTTVLQIPIRYLETVRRAVEQAFETNDLQFIKKGGLGVEANCHTADRNCEYCDESRERMVDIIVGVDHRSEAWKEIHNSVLFCEPCASNFTQTIKNELETNPEKYLGYMLK